MSPRPNRRIAIPVKKVIVFLSRLRFVNWVSLSLYSKNVSLSCTQLFRRGRSLSLQQVVRLYGSTCVRCYTLLFALSRHHAIVHRVICFHSCICRCSSTVHGPHGKACGRGKDYSLYTETMRLRTELCCHSCRNQCSGTVDRRPWSSLIEAGAWCVRP